MLDDCGLPDTVVHGDFHPGNWRRGDGAPVVLDFADAHLGNPVLDGLRVIDFLPPGRRRTAASAWTAAWTAAVPRSRPAEALRIAEPLAPRIVNLAEWSAYLLRRIDHQILAGADTQLAELADEARGYPGVAEPDQEKVSLTDRVFVPLRIMNGGRELRFLNMVATLGTALDIAAAELVIEAFYPADRATSQLLEEL